MISRSFLKSSIVFTAGGALPMLASFVLLPFYTNFVTDLNYARLLYYISVSAIAQILFSGATDSYFGVRYSQLFSEPEKQKSFVRTVSLLLLALGAVLIALSAAFGARLFAVIFDPRLHMDFWPYGFLSILTGFFNSYFKTASICLIYKSRPGRFLFYNGINFVTTLAFSLGGLYLWPGELAGPIGGRLLSGVVIFLCARLVFRHEGGAAADRSFLPDMAAFAGPYVLYGLSMWVLAQVDRYMLQSQAISGINSYDLVIKCFIGVEFLQNSLLAVIYPKVYDIWARNNSNATTPESNRYFNVFTVVNIVQVLLFCIVLPWLYDWLIRKDYFYLGLQFMTILAAGYVVRSVVSFYLAIVLYTRSTWLMLGIFLSTALVQIVLTWLLVRDFGIEGALWAGLAVKVLQALAFAVFSPSVFVIRFNRFKILILPAIFVLVNTVYFAIAPAYSMLFFVAQLAVFGLAFTFIFRREMRRVVTDLLAPQPR